MGGGTISLLAIVVAFTIATAVKLEGVLIPHHQLVIKFEH
jgi:phage-related protein